MTIFNADYNKAQIDAYEKNFIGETVICLSNEPEPIVKGKLVFWTEVCASNQKLPVVELENGKQLIIFGHILPFTDELWNMMEKMNSKEAHIMFSAIRGMFEKCRRMDRH